MILKHAQYEIIEILEISKSLRSQYELIEEINMNVTKAIVNRNDKKEILYFIEGFKYGAGSIINISKNLELPVLYNDDYKIIKKTPYKINQELIKALYNKNKKII